MGFLSELAWLLGCLVAGLELISGGAHLFLKAAKFESRVSSLSGVQSLRESAPKPTRKPHNVGFGVPEGVCRDLQVKPGIDDTGVFKRTSFLPEVVEVGQIGGLGLGPDTHSDWG